MVAYGPARMREKSATSSPASGPDCRPLIRHECPFSVARLSPVERGQSVRLLECAIGGLSCQAGNH